MHTGPRNRMYARIAAKRDSLASQTDDRYAATILTTASVGTASSQEIEKNGPDSGGTNTAGSSFMTEPLSY